MRTYKSFKIKKKLLSAPVALSLKMMNFFYKKKRKNTVKKTNFTCR